MAAAESVVRAERDRWEPLIASACYGWRAERPREEAGVRDRAYIVSHRCTQYECPVACRVARIGELSGVNADVVGAFYLLAHNQAAPVLSVRSHAIKTEPTATLVEEQVASLVACGAVVDAGLHSHGDGGRAHWSCLRFPVGGHDEKPVVSLAREMGSAAQSEMDRRWSEVHPSELS